MDHSNERLGREEGGAPAAWVMAGDGVAGSAVGYQTLSTTHDSAAEKNGLPRVASHSKAQSTSS